MSYPNKRDSEPMSAAVASEYVRTMIHRESTGPGDNERAMQKIAEKYGLSFWTLDHLRKRKAKTIDVGLFSRIRSAYFDACERQVARIQQELAIEKALGANDNLEDLVAEASALAARVQAQRAAR